MKNVKIIEGNSIRVGFIGFQFCPSISVEKEDNLPGIKFLNLKFSQSIDCAAETNICIYGVEKKDLQKIINSLEDLSNKL